MPFQTKTKLVSHKSTQRTCDGAGVFGVEYARFMVKDVGQRFAGEWRCAVKVGYIRVVQVSVTKHTVHLLS